MTSCDKKWYFFYNYLKGEYTTDNIKFYIEKVYGEVKSIKFNEGYEETFEEQIKKAMIPILNYQHTIDKDDLTHIDLFEIDCQVPTLLNLYYVDKQEEIKELAPGDSFVTVIKNGQKLELAVDGNYSYTLEVYHPMNAPRINYTAGQKVVETVQVNSLIEDIPIGDDADKITITELGDNSMTRVIIKVNLDYKNKTNNWEMIENGIWVNRDQALYVYEVTNDRNKIFDLYEAILQVTANETDLSSVCASVSLGAAIIPPDEICKLVRDKGRFTKFNFLNPLMRYDYYETEAYHYYVTLVQRDILGGTDLDFRQSYIPTGADYYHYKDQIYSRDLSQPMYPTPNIIMEIPDGNFLYAQVEMCNSSITADVEIYNEDQDIKEAAIKVKPGLEGMNIIFKPNNLDPSTLIIDASDLYGDAFVRHTATMVEVNKYKAAAMEPTINKRKLSWTRPFPGQWSYIIYYNNKGTYVNNPLTLCQIAQNGEIPSGSKYLKSDLEYATLDYGNVTKTVELQILAKQKDGARQYILSAPYTVEYDGSSTSDFFLKLENGEVLEFAVADGTVSRDNTNLFFYYDYDSVPEGGVGTFKFDSHSLGITSMDDFKCIFVNVDTPESSFNGYFNDISGNGICKGTWAVDEGELNAIFKVDKSLRRFIIKISNSNSSGKFSVAVSRGSFKVDSYPTQHIPDNNYQGLMPYILNLEEFNNKNFMQVLIYKYSESMNVFYLDDDKQEPVEVMAGHILVLNTEAKEIKSKYAGHKELIILAHSLDSNEEHKARPLDTFIEFIGLTSDEVVTYLISSEEGRALSRPIHLEATKCSTSNPKYIIYNYLKSDDSGKIYQAHIDPMHGKEISISVATTHQDSWTNFKARAFHVIPNYAYEFPSGLDTYIDVYEIKCQSPISANLFYVEKGVYPEYMNEGDVLIKNLSPKEKLEIEVDGEYDYTLSVWHPNNSPKVEYTVGYTTNIVTINEVIGGIDIPDSADKIIIQEMAGDSSTRIIIKVSHRYLDTRDWVKIDEKNDIYFKPEDLLFVYKVTNANNFYNIYGSRFGIKTEDSDNVKFCYSTNIGAALATSDQNCFMISGDVYSNVEITNPLVRFNTYETFIDSVFFSFKVFGILGSSDLHFQAVLDSTDCNVMLYNGYPKVINTNDFGTATPQLLVEVPEGQYVYQQVEVCSFSSSAHNYIEVQNFNVNNKQKGDPKMIYKNKQGQFIYYENKYEPQGLIINEATPLEVFVKHIGLNEKISEPTVVSMNLQYSKKRLTYNTPFSGAFDFIIYIGKGKQFVTKKPTICELTTNNYIIPGAVKMIQTSNTRATIDLGQIDAEYDAFILAKQKDGAQLYIVSEAISFNYTGSDTDTYWMEIVDEFGDDNFLHFNDKFKKNNNPIYLEYNFDKALEGNFGTLKFDIDSMGQTEPLDDFKCIFVDKSTTHQEIEEIFADSTTPSSCYGEWAADEGELNAVYKMDPKKLKLVIRFFNAENGYNFNVIIPKKSTYIDPAWGSHSVVETNYKGLMPYYITIEDYINNDIDDLILYKKEENMYVYVIDEFQTVPLKLMEANIISLKTDRNSIHQKYRDSEQLFLLAHALDVNIKHLKEETKFDVITFKEKQPITYLISSSLGRTLNLPIHLQMDNCAQKNYFIYNYNQPESTRRVHIDMIYGKIKEIKISMELKDSWKDLVDSMTVVEGLQFDTKEKSDGHIDVIQIECESPSLINFYYIDTTQEIAQLNQGQVMVRSLLPEKSYTVHFNDIGLLTPYTVEVYDPSKEPSVRVEMGLLKADINENSLYTGLSDSEGDLKITELAKKPNTRVIVKLGHQIYSETTIWEEIIKETLYKKRTSMGLNEAFYIYILPNDDDRYAIKRISLPIRTADNDNVKVCYSINLGAGLDPSLENCVILSDKSFTFIEVKNPLVQYRTYATSNEEVYISIKAVDLANDLVFGDPIKEKLPGEFTKVSVPKVIDFDGNDTAITFQSPSDKNKYVYAQLITCAEFPSNSYTIKDVYSQDKLADGQIENNGKGQVISFDNKLVPASMIFGDVKALKGLPLFVKHVGSPDKLDLPKIGDITFEYTASDNVFKIADPFNSKFNYSVYFAEKNAFNETKPTICTLYDTAAQNRVSFIFKLETNNKEIHLRDIKELDSYTELAMIVVAKETKNAEMYVMSDLIELNRNKDQKTTPSGSKALIIIIIILVVIVLALTVYFLYIKLTKKNVANNSVVINDSMGTSLVSHNSEGDAGTGEKPEEAE